MIAWTTFPPVSNYSIPVAITATACMDKSLLRNIRCIFSVLQQSADGNRERASTTAWPELKMPPTEHLFWKKQHGNNVPPPIRAPERDLRGIFCWRWGHTRHRSPAATGLESSHADTVTGPCHEAFPSTGSRRHRAAPGRTHGTGCSPANSQQSWQGSHPWKPATSNVPMSSQTEQEMSSLSSFRTPRPRAPACTEGEARGHLVPLLVQVLGDKENFWDQGGQGSNK